MLPKLSFSFVFHFAVSHWFFRDTSMIFRNARAVIWVWESRADCWVSEAASGVRGDRQSGAEELFPIHPCGSRDHRIVLTLPFIGRPIKLHCEGIQKMQTFKLRRLLRNFTGVTHKGLVIATYRYNLYDIKVRTTNFNCQKNPFQLTLHCIEHICLESFLVLIYFIEIVETEFVLWNDWWRWRLPIFFSFLPAIIANHCYPPYLPRSINIKKPLTYKYLRQVSQWFGKPILFQKK